MNRDFEWIKSLTHLAPDAPGGSTTPTAIPTDPKPADPKPTDPAPTDPEPAKTLTQEEVDAAIARVVARERAAAEKREREAIERGKKEGQTEAERLAKMNEKERAEELQRKTAEEAEKRQKEISDREAALTRRELRITAAEELRKKGVDDSLVDILDLSGADACNESIAKVEKAFAAAVKKAVEDKLKESGVQVLRGGDQKNLDALPDDQYYKSLHPDLGKPKTTKG